jgi:uncharacterized protein
MIYAGMLGHLSPLRKIILMALLALLSMLMVMLGGWLIALLVYDDFLSLLAQMGNFKDKRVIGLLKFFQILNQIGLFIIPPLVFAYLDGGKIKSYLRLDVVPGLQVLILSLVMVFAILPLVHWTAAINEMMRFPDWLQGIENWMKQSEESAKQITDAFLNVDSTGGLLLNLLMIALLPAIGEELLFRGVLQKLLQQWFKNVHWAILVTAILFSAMHLQFYGFLPRTILGIVFGYLFVITRSLWVPILVHLFNNGAAVLAAFLFRRNILENDYHEIGQVSNPLWVIGSLLMVLILFTAIYKLSGTRKDILP